MADNIEIGDLVARISFDDTGLNKSLATINREMKLVESEFQQASSAIESYGDEEEKAKVKTDALTKQMQLQQQRINKINEALEKSVREKGADSKETQQLAIQLNKAKTAYNKLDSELKDTNNRLKDQQDELDDTGSKWGGLGSVLDDALGAFKSLAGPAGIAAVGTGLVALSIKTANFASDYNRALDKVKIATGDFDDASGELEATLERLYSQNYGDSLEDLGESLATVAQTSGATGKDLEDLTKNALLLRDSFGFDVSESIRTADSLMKQFGITGDEAFTLIAQATQNGADRSGDLLDTLNEYAPQFEALGFSAEEFTNVLITGAEEGAFQIDKIGDAVKEFNIRAKDGSDSTTEAFTALGLSAEELSADFAAGGVRAQEAFRQTLTALASIEDPLERNRIGVALFGTQFEDLEADAVLALNNISDTADQTADTLEKMNEIKYDDFGTALRGIGRNLELGIVKPLGDKVLPKLENFSKWFEDNLPQIQNATSTTVDFMIEDFNTFVENLQDTYPKVGEFFDEVHRVMGETGVAITEFVEDIPKEIEKFIGDFAQVGSDLMEGLFNGIAGWAAKLSKKASDIANDIKSKLNDVFRFGSPSKVTTQMGEWVGEGLAIGMDRSLGTVSRQAAALSEAAMPTTGNAGVTGTAGQGSAVAGNVSFEGMFSGAVFNVRNDNDIRAIAQELFALQRNAMRGVGFA